ncbi:MAG: efflux RND transporter periplasmic adaptor subunit [Bacteroidetes bacterium]|nr:efflux RND transporter periplasmic adaptor subunit [Bacteroidota bacterium]
MKRIFHIHVLLLPLALLSGLGGCGEHNSESAGDGGGNNNIASAPVTTLELTLTDFNEVITVTGTIASYEDVKVPADEGGKVLQWLVPLGAYVRSGQTLVQLDSAIVRTNYDAAVAHYNIAQTNYERQINVYKEQGISELQLKTLEYQRDAARAQMEMSRVRLERTRVKSPINGTVNARLIEAGEMSAPGQPVAHVVNTDRLKILAGIPERHANSFRVGENVSFTVDAASGDTFRGVIRFIGAAVVRDNRTLPVEVDIIGAQSQLKPDMIAKMSVTLRGRTESIVIPEDAALKTEKDEFVAYVVEDNLARERKLTIGGTNKGRMLVTGGLQAGDRLIIAGQQHVADGQAVVVSQ